ncbi:MAG: thiamine pyrophosphate-dependent enzyme [Victivallales bacterium]
MTGKYLLSGNEAAAEAAFESGVSLGTGYPGTPSTEILEHFAELGGKAQWSPNEKVALEVGIGAAYGKARAIVTMKHVGLNVAADPFFTAAYTGVDGGLVIVSADDPGMSSSQNEQDNRHLAEAAEIPMLEPSDSQEAYDFTIKAFELSEKWKIPVLLRLTTRVCHSKTIVEKSLKPSKGFPDFEFARDLRGKVMIPSNARPAHVRLREKIAELAEFNEESIFNRVENGTKELGIITSGISYQYAKEAEPEAGFLKLGMTYPLPLKMIRAFAGKHKRCVVIEEGDPYLFNLIMAAGILAEGKHDIFRLGELNQKRVRKILAGDNTPEEKMPAGKAPQLCPGCPHKTVYEALKKLGCTVPGDIGCYSLGTLPPYEAMDTLLCMGAGITAGLGLRHILPEGKAMKVVSVIGDSTFIHSGITGLVDMVYNRPPTGHVVIILDNSTTAMTGLQEHPASGGDIRRNPAHKVKIEDVAKAVGIENVDVIDMTKNPDDVEKFIVKRLAEKKTSVIIARRPCILSVKQKNRKEQEICTPAKI